MIYMASFQQQEYCDILAYKLETNLEEFDSLSVRLAEMWFLRLCIQMYPRFPKQSAQLNYIKTSYSTHSYLTRPMQS